MFNKFQGFFLGLRQGQFADETRESKALKPGGPGP
jgi:hypothetical protein